MSGTQCFGSKWIFFFPELCLDLVNTNGEIMNQRGKEKSQPLNGSRKNKRKRVWEKCEQFWVMRKSDLHLS